MIPFEKLTRIGKARRLRSLVLHALAQYDLNVHRVRLLGMFTNALFRVDTWEGEPYVMRACSPGWRTDEDLLSEMAWLAALQDAPEIHAPRPVAARDGKWMILDQIEGVNPVRCMVMSFVPGKPLGKHLTEPNLFKMGQLFARLHQASLKFVPPPGFTTRKMEQVLARGEPDALFTPQVEAALPAELWGVISRVREKVTAAYTRLYADPTGLRVIHHDLWHDNIHIHCGVLYPLDFEDTVWGYPVQDIAMAMQDLMDDTEPEQFEPLYTAFRAGYESVEPWPEAYPGEVDVFRAGRMLWVANFVARRQNEHLQGYLERKAPMLVAFLENGKLRKQFL